MPHGAQQSGVRSPAGPRYVSLLLNAYDKRVPAAIRISWAVLTLPTGHTATDTATNQRTRSSSAPSAASACLYLAASSLVPEIKRAQELRGTATRFRYFA